MKISYNQIIEKFWTKLNSVVFYSISSKKSKTNWIIFSSLIVASLAPFWYIFLKSPPSEVIVEILYWQSATIFISNLLLPVQFSLAIVGIILSAILMLPLDIHYVYFDNLVFVILLLCIVYLLTNAFTRLKQWDMESIQNSMKLLQIKQNRINSLFDNEFYAIVVHQNGIIHDINDTFKTIFQYDLSDIKGNNLFATLFQGDMDSKNKIIATKSEFNLETYAYRKNGEKIPIEIIGKAYEEEGENLKICFIRDISSKKEMYSELMRHKNYLQKILDALPHAIFVKDMKSMSIQTANKLAFKEFINSSSSIGPTDIIDSSTEYQRGIELIKKTKLPLTIEESHIYENGVEKFIEMYIYPFLDEKGEIEELLEIIMDITTRKKIEQRLKNTLKELRDIRDALDEHAIVSITDPMGNITYVNDKFITVSGFSREELIGQNHRIIKSGYHSKNFFKNIWDTISSGHIWQGEIKNLSKNGEFYWVFSTIVPFLDENHKPYQYVSIRTEITELKTVTEQLKEAKEEAERANKSKSTFLANMSHEIRTPLNAVLGMAELTLSTGLTLVQRKYLSLIQSSGENLLNIINEILDFSKIEAGKLVIENRDFHLRHILFSTLHIFIYQAKEKGLRMSINIDPSVPDHLIGDPQRIRQILINLVGNSLKFTEEGNIIIEIEPIKYKDEENEITLKFIVADSGIGIPVSKQKLIFESFTQEDSSTTRKYGGTGLGTTISRELTNKMGGEMGVMSPVRFYRFDKGGPGSEFWFTIKCSVNLESEKKFYESLQLKNIIAKVMIFSPQILESVSETFRKLNVKFDKIKTGDITSFKNAEQRCDLLLLEMPESIDKLGSMLMEFQTKFNMAGHTRIVVIVEDEYTLDTSILYEMGVSYYLYKPVNEKSILRMFNFIMHEATDSIMFPSKLIPGKKGLELDKKITESQTEDKKKKHILIAEDNEINQFLLKTIMEGLGCNVSLAANGLEAVKMIRNKPDYFDIIFMDLQMPEMNGYQATEEIRKNISKTIPIVAVTANAFKEDKERSIQSGMNDFIAKPYSKDTLISIIEKYDRNQNN